MSHREHDALSAGERLGPCVRSFVLRGVDRRHDLRRTATFRHTHQPVAGEVRVEVQVADRFGRSLGFVR